MSDNERASWLELVAAQGRKFNPRVRLKPLAAKLLAVSNALWQRPDSLRRVRGEI